MTTYNDVHPSNYIIAEDLKGRDRTVTLKSIDFDGKVWRAGKEERAIVLFFAEAKKGLVLNATNHDVIAFKLRYGKELEAWVGKPITLFPTTDSRVRGDDKDVVRVRPVIPQPKPAKKEETPHAPVESETSEAQG